MKLSFVKNLKGGEILAKNILAGDGEVLLGTGIPLTTQSISRLKHHGIFFAYIEAEHLEDITADKKLDDLKQKTTAIIPKIFYDIYFRNTLSMKNSLETVNELIDYIIDEGFVNIGLYEVKSFDDYTYVHCVDTGIMSVILGLSQNLNREDLRNLGTAAMLHDIGKISIPKSIINKPSSLTKDEFDEIKLHPILGEIVLANSGILSEQILDTVLQHHERIDGKGYPYNLNGNQLSILSKTLSICDVFTAVSANRTYRKRFSPNDAYELILSSAGTQFDMDIVSIFRQTFAIYPLGCCVMLSNRVEGYVVAQNNHFPDRPIIRVTYDHITKQSISPYEINLLDMINITIVEVI